MPEAPVEVATETGSCATTSQPSTDHLPAAAEVKVSSPETDQIGACSGWDACSTTLEHDDELGWVFGCHIPETGPLSPEAVDESLALVRPTALPVYREFPVGRITCTSWLLDAGLIRRLPDESNVARFTPCGTPADGRRDLLYFCFRVETASGQPIDLASLPRDSTLRRAALDLLHGEGPVVQEGWLPIP